MAVGRPYFQTRTADLETLVRDNPTDRRLLKQIAAELKHRSRPSARQLAAVIARLLDQPTIEVPTQPQLELPVAPEAPRVKEALAHVDAPAEAELGLSEPTEAMDSPIANHQMPPIRPQPEVPSSTLVMPEDIDRKRVRQVFGFLQALDQLRTPVVRQVAESPWNFWLKDVPEHECIQFGDWRAPETSAGGSAEIERPFVLRVERPELSRAPAPPKELQGRILGRWEDPESAIAERRHTEVRDPNTDEVVRIKFEDDSERVELWEEYSERWFAWSKTEAPARKVERLFVRLHELHNTFAREGERFELVVGDGVLSWKVRSGGLFHPLIVRPVQLEFSPEVPAFTIVETGASSQFQSSLFRGVDEVTEYQSTIGKYREELEARDLSPLDRDETTSFLRGFAPEIDPRGTFLGDEHPKGEAAHPTLARSPVLLVRKRVQGFAAFIERVLEHLGAVEALPETLLGITGNHSGWGNATGTYSLKPWEEPEDLLLSKAANPEQIRVARTLRQQPGVLVQGPPGTGKTHTIGNLIGDLLANGKSVLVTSHTSKALRVLRDKVERDLQPLCVSVLDNDAESRAMLDKSIQDIANRLDSESPERLQLEASKLEAERARLIQQLSTAQQELIEARKAENTPVRVGDLEFQPIEAAKRVARDQQDHGWIPAGVRRGAALPLTAEQVAELYRTNGVLSPDDEEQLRQPLPKLGDLPSADAYEQREARRYRFTQEREARFDSLWAKPAGAQDLGTINRLLEKLSQQRAIISDTADWRIALIQAGMRGGSDRQVWDQMVEDLNSTIEEIDRTKQAGLRNELTLPSDAALREEIAAMLAHAENGGSFGWFVKTTKPRWKAVLEQARVNGRTPESADSLRILQDALQHETAVHDLVARWRRYWDVKSPYRAPGFVGHPIGID